jgi:hypothetical protein
MHIIRENAYLCRVIASYFFVQMTYLTMAEWFPALAWLPLIGFCQCLDNVFIEEFYARCATFVVGGLQRHASGPNNTTKKINN